MLPKTGVPLSRRIMGKAAILSVSYFKMGPQTVELPLIPGDTGLFHILGLGTSISPPVVGNLL